MPKIPIIGPVEFRGGSDAGAAASGPEALSPEQDDALRALQDRTARIDRELAVSQAWRAGVERLSDAEQTPGGPPVDFTRGFLDDLDRERQQLVMSSPPDGQEPLERDLLDLRSDFLDRAAQAEASGMALRRRTGLYDALGEYDAGVTQDPGLFDQAVGRMDSLISGLGLPEDRQGSIRTYVRTALGNAAIDGLMKAPARAERVLSDGLYDDVLPEPVKALRLTEAQERVTRDDRLNRERTVAELTEQAQDGTASDEAILEAERKQTLSPADSAYLRQASATATAAVAVRDARIRRVASATERLDPSDPEYRAAGSDYWDSVAEVYVSDDPVQQRENELRFVERTGVLPKGLENKYRGALYSRDPAVVVQGANAIAHLASQDPALVQGIPADEVRCARAIADYAALGVEPDRAVELGDKKIAAEGIPPAGTAQPGELQVAAADEPPVMSDVTEPDSIPASENGETVGPGANDNPAADENVSAPEDNATTASGETADDITDADVRDREQTGSDTEESGEGSASQKEIDWPEVERLHKILETEGEEAFKKVAEAGGLDADRVRLFLDVLAAKPEDVRQLRQRINKSYGSGYGLGVWLDVQNVLRGDGDREERKQYLTHRLSELRQDAPHVNENITDMFDPAMAPVFAPRNRGRGSGGARPGRPPGPMRRGDFARDAEGEQLWRKRRNVSEAAFPLVSRIGST
jgi:hypothetical protein